MDRLRKSLFILLFLLVGCSAAPISPTALPETPTVALLPTSAPTDDPPTPTSAIPTNTPEVKTAPPPPGLLYYYDTGVWLVGEDSIPKLLVEGINDYIFRLSGDQKKALIKEKYDAEYFILDIDSGNLSHVDVGMNYEVCSLSWLDGKPGFLYAIVQHVSNSGHMFCHAMPALLRDDGSGLTLLTNISSEHGGSNPSHNGDYIAFSADGKPWLHQFGVGTQLLKPVGYGIDIADEMTFAHPSWSHNQQYIAWVVYEKVPDKQTQGVIIFDIINNTSKTYYSYNVCCWEGLYTNIYWSSNDSHFAIHNPVNDTPHDLLWVLSVEGTLTYQDIKNDVIDFNWAPNGDVFAYSYVDPETRKLHPKEKKYRLKIVSVSGEEIIDTTSPRNFFWSQNSEYLILTDTWNGEKSVYLLVEYSNWAYSLLLLPDNTKILGWISFE